MALQCTFLLRKKKSLQLSLCGTLYISVHWNIKSAYYLYCYRLQIVPLSQYSNLPMMARL